jgi:hypothetical protein
MAICQEDTRNEVDLRLVHRPVKTIIRTGKARLLIPCLAQEEGGIKIKKKNKR